MFSNKQQNTANESGDGWVLLGFIHDMISRLSECNSKEELWNQLCRDIRWILPVDKIALFWEIDSTPKLIKLYDKANPLSIFDIEDEQSSLFLDAISKQPLIKIHPVSYFIDNFFPQPDNIPLVNCLLQDADSTLVITPIRLKSKNIGTLMLTLKGDISQQKQKYYKSVCSIYAQHISLNYRLIQAEIEFTNTNQELQQAQKELQKQIKSQQIEHMKVSILREEGLRNEKRLEEHNKQLLAQEEELRMNAEELQTTNNHLAELHRKLEHALLHEQESRKSLQDTQAQLVHSEKMASLGAMTAGIAHEINNPLNFITGGAQSLSYLLQDLYEVMQVYEQLEVSIDEESRKMTRQKLERIKEEVEFNEMKTDLLLLVKDINHGADRAAEVVKSLRNFSRLDEHELKYADIHEGIESTLVILRSKLREGEGISIERFYDERLPKIECYPGQLNQVFMNILANAIDAMGKDGNLTIRTLNSNEEKIQIDIQDTGSGIPEGVLSKIFDPFFTTKDVGAGTGLGLSISYRIIEKHHGQIQVNSEEGIGTTFSIILPKKSPINVS